MISDVVADPMLTSMAHVALAVAGAKKPPKGGREEGLSRGARQETSVPCEQLVQKAVPELSVARVCKSRLQDPTTIFTDSRNHHRETKYSFEVMVWQALALTEAQAPMSRSQSGHIALLCAPVFCRR